ncbi:MAG TPA: hypothetical protein VIW03_18580 [Anaeromyxobacter sp.]
MPRATTTAAAVAALFLATACAAPRTGATSPSVAAGGAAQAPAKAESPKTSLVCRTERPTGSNIPRRVCYSQDDLDEMSQAAQDAHRRATQSATQPRHD